MEYEDRIKMIYRDGNGHNYTRTKYLTKIDQNPPKLEFAKPQG